MRRDVSEMKILCATKSWAIDTYALKKMIYNIGMFLVIQGVIKIPLCLSELFVLNSHHTTVIGMFLKCFIISKLP